MNAPPWLQADEFAAVLRDAQRGSEEAFTRLFHCYAGAVVAYARMQGMRDPEDFANETFIGVVRAVGTFAGDEPAFRTWLFTIAQRRIVDSRRKGGRSVHLVWVDPTTFERPAHDDTERTALDAAATAEVRRLCDSLAPDQRDVLLMRLVGGLTINEIAAALGKSPGAVKALQRRGLNSIRRILDEEGVPQ